MTDRNEPADALPISAKRSRLTCAVPCPSAGVRWVVETDGLLLLLSPAAPVRLLGAEAALWALIVRGHDRKAIVIMMAAITGESSEIAGGYIGRLLALWEDKGYLTQGVDHG